MNAKAATRVFFVGVALLCLLTADFLRAQDAASLSGTVKDASGRAVPNAKVSAKNVTTGQSTESQTDSAGLYTVPNLAPGDYDVSVSAAGFDVNTTRVVLGGGARQTQDVRLATAQTQPQTPTPPTNPTPTPTENLPNAPSSSKTEPSLQDLGFSQADTQGNAKQQALLDKRTHMLKIHQRMGLITAAPLIATVILGPGAGGKSEGTATRDLHVALGAVTGDLYGITAWYAIRAPRTQGTPKRGPIRFHEAMAWIHGPGMILTPIAGALAFEQKNNGEKLHGLAAAHGPIAIVTAGAFGAALLSVSVKF